MNSKIMSKTQFLARARALASSEQLLITYDMSESDADWIREHDPELAQKVLACSAAAGVIRAHIKDRLK